MRLKGFTLIEILVVIGIFSLLFFCSLPSLNCFSAKNRLNIDAKTLSGDLRLLQAKAIAKHEIQSLNSISFSSSGNCLAGGAGTLTLTNKFNQAKKVIVSSLGRIRIE